MTERNQGRFAPSCSVVVCTRNRPDQLDQCLGALEGSRYPQIDVLVVDNTPSDEQAREVAERWGVRYVVEPVAGLSRARNRGVRACTAEIVAFLDDDAIPEPDWLSALAQEFEDPLVMAVTGRTLPLRLTTEAQRQFELSGGFDIGCQTRRVVDGRTPSWFEIANFGGVGNGGNMAFRRSAFAVWPGFDERLGRGTPMNAGEEHRFFSRSLIAATGLFTHRRPSCYIRTQRAGETSGRAISANLPKPRLTSRSCSRKNLVTEVRLPGTFLGL